MKRPAYYSPKRDWQTGCHSMNALIERKKVIKPQKTVDEYGNEVVKNLIVRDERN